MAYGGYQILDLKNAKLTTDGTTVEIKGSFKTLTSTEKPIMLCNWYLDGVKQPDCYPQQYRDPDTIYLYVRGPAGENIVVTDEDEVTYYTE